jgi:HAD superfamily hydrolase (TIGR01549 family)
MKVKAVFFDAGLTLFNVYPKGKTGMFSYFCSLVFSEDQLAKLDLMEGAKRAELHFQVSQKNKEYKRSENFWIDNYAKGLMGAGFTKEDAYKWSPVVNEQVDKIKKTYSLIDGVEGMLEALKTNGYLLAVVSNWRDQSLRSDIEQLGISSYFDYIADSSVEGVSKPDPAIFNIVLNHLNIKPDEAVHTGDLYYSDVVGAQNAGINAILYDELDALGKEFQCQRICKITDILEIVGVAL